MFTSFYLQVQAYLSVLEDSKGYYWFRWGDAPVHTMVIYRLLSNYHYDLHQVIKCHHLQVVKIFLPFSQVHKFGFEYRHQVLHSPVSGMP